MNIDTICLIVGYLKELDYDIWVTRAESVDAATVPGQLFTQKKMRSWIGCCLGEWLIYHNICATAVKFSNAVVNELFTPIGVRINPILPRSFVVFSIHKMLFEGIIHRLMFTV